MTKILFSDLDGTIIGKKAIPLHEKNISALKTLREQGHIVALCTGRNNIDILPTLKAVDIPYDYMVLCNGAYIVDREGKIIYQNNIPKDLGEKMLSTFIKEDCLMVYFCDGKSCVLKKKDGIHIIDEKGDITSYRDFSIFETKMREAEVYTIFGINQEDEKTDFLDGYVKKTMPLFEDGISWFYNTAFIDIIGPNSSKGLGMKKLAEYLGIKHENIYAIGDSYNDISMIELAGHGYTFRRSDEVVQKKASHLVDYLYEVVEDILEENS